MQDTKCYCLFGLVQKTCAWHARPVSFHTYLIKLLLLLLLPPKPAEPAKPPQRGKYRGRNYRRAPEEVVHQAALQNVMAVHKTCMMRSGDKAWQQLSPGYLLHLHNPA